MLGSRYQLHEVIGEGGMGKVFRATDRLTGAEIALKQVTTAPQLLSYNSRPADTSDYDQYRIGLANEFSVLASLRHPHIISVLDYGFDVQRRPYFTMELLRNAESILKASAEMGIEQKVDLIIQLLSALAYLHRRGLLHRDLKPANVLVTKGNVRVLDFGLAVTQGEAQDMSGTYAYMSPEILRGGEPSIESDLYSVGVLAFEMLALQHPHETGNLNNMLNRILFKPAELELLSDTELLAGVIGRMLEKEPSHRYHSAEEAAAAFSKAIGRPTPRESTDIRDSFLQAATFVGRETEIAKLEVAITELREGSGSAWLIGGESGIGKTRLINEIRTRALVKGIPVLRGQAVDEGAAPYQVWLDALRLLCLQTEVTLAEASVLKAIVPDIGMLLQRDVPDAPELDTRASQRRLLTAIEDIFSRQQSPLVVILEDLHWTSESLDLLQRVSRNAASKPVIFLGTYRDDERPDIPDVLPDMTVIPLKRLPRNQIQKLTRSMLGAQAASDQEILDLLERETEGNVFFIVEVVRTLAEEAGNLQNILEMKLPERVFAEGMMTVVKRRLDRVPEDARGLLLIAAVASRALDLPVIRKLAGQRDLDNWLTACADAAVLDVQDNQWRFAHDRMREVMVEGMPIVDRRVAHRRIAEAIETVYLNDENRANLLAYHWSEAGDTKKEAHYAALAGRQALRSGAHEDALELLERALALSEDAGLSQEQIALIEQELGGAYFSMGQLARSRPHLKRAVELLGLPEAKSKPVGLLQEVLRQAWFRLVPRLSVKRDTATINRHATASRATMLLSAVGLFENERIKAIYYTIRSANLAEKVGRAAPGELAHGYGSLSIAAGTVGVEKLADLYVRLHDELADQIDSLEEKAAALRVTAIFMNSYGRWKDTIERYERAIELAEQAGQYRLWAESMMGMQRAKVYSGRLQEAFTSCDEITQVALRQNDPQYQAMAYSVKAETELRLGKARNALHLLDASLPIHHKLEDTSNALYAYGLSIQSHMELGDFKAAEDVVREAEAIINVGPPVAYWTIEGYAGVADYWITHWQNEPTAHNKTRAKEALDNLGVYAKGFPIGEPRYLTQWSRFEQLDGNKAKAKKLAEEAVEEAQRLNMKLEEVAARQQLITLLPKGSHEARQQQYRIDEMNIEMKGKPKATDSALTEDMMADTLRM